MSRPMIRRVIFDLGGVVLRWRPAVLLAQQLPRHTATPQALAQLQAGFFGPDWWDFDRGTVSTVDLADRLVRRLALGVPEVLSVIEAGPEELQPVEATLALMRRLREAGCRLYYLSNMPLPYAEHLERRHDFFRWFEDGVFSSRVQCIKPEPRIFELALERFGCAPQEAVFLDDHPLNVEAARALGLHAVQFRDAAQAEAELQALGVT
ncbi:HAD family hydrolase [Caldimonas thermodepolymerans]|nr:HAD family phosphatase [Caldimonas thermodepolymerans]UZG45073.1 HAD family phosphatase [Caldimonas thermodepolymerans]